MSFRNRENNNMERFGGETSSTIKQTITYKKSYTFNLMIKIEHKWGNETEISDYG